MADSCPLDFLMGPVAWHHLRYILKFSSILLGVRRFNSQFCPDVNPAFLTDSVELRVFLQMHLYYHILILNLLGGFKYKIYNMPLRHSAFISDNSKILCSNEKD